MNDYIRIYCETCQKELKNRQEHDKCYEQKHYLRTKIKLIITDG